MPASTRQLALQFAAVLLVLSLAWPYYGMKAEMLPWGPVALAIGATALTFATVSRQPWWWRLIHGGFAPLAWAVAQLHVDPGWFLLAFILQLLVYRGAVTGQVPLYLSNPQTAEALADLARERSAKRILDLGAGIGSLQAPLARALPQTRVDGLENAPLTWALGRMRLAGLANAGIRYGDMWQADLSAYDLVYTFLSPEPMDYLGQKAAAEMAEGSLLVSNSFPIPWADAELVIEVDDRRQTRLYCYTPARLQAQLAMAVAAEQTSADNPQ
ncbi:MAG TPA: class I SAM-dependent methyltransferase [Azospira sp.]|nr:class I SAM-dependent methyltransferase [Azospira sp.]